MAARALVSKLLRIALPPPPPSPEAESSAQPDDDPVLEWSYLLLVQLLRAGRGAEVFDACGVRLPPDSEPEGDEAPPVLFTPEQLVLLHLWEEALDDKHAAHEDGGNVLLADGGALCSLLAARVGLDSKGEDGGAVLCAAGVAAAVRLVGGVLAAMDGSGLALGKEALVGNGLAAALLRLLRREGGRADGSIPIPTAAAAVRRFEDRGVSWHLSVIK